MNDQEKLEKIKSLIENYAPISSEEIQEAYDTCHETGNFNDTHDNAVEIGERTLADDIRFIINS